jgi:hypothetical protein
MNQLILGVALLFGGHAIAVGVAWFFTRHVPLNIHVAVLALLGFVQLVYAVPLVALFLFKRKPRAALGVIGGAVFTGIVSGIGLTL